MSAIVESARQDWAEGRRQFDEEARLPGRGDGLYHQLDAVATELRRRLGEVYTLAELADAYLGAERWAQAAIDDRAPAHASAPTLALVTDTAFQVASRHAVDYAP
jgi:hypothetical protein